jgi:hypothetical protein
MKKKVDTSLNRKENELGFAVLLDDLFPIEPLIRRRLS